MMKKKITGIFNSFFAPSIDLRVRLFHILAMGGVAAGLGITILSLINDADPVNILVNFISMVVSLVLLVYSRKTGRYRICYIITILAIFGVLFPAMFFSAGGYHSGMPSFFIFATVFTIFMLEGRTAMILSVAELLLYVGLCLIAYFHPESVTFFEGEDALLFDIILGFVSVTLILGACLFLHFRLYNQQQKLLAQQNALLERSSKAKTEFLANMSHEMRTPLTVISVNVQTVGKILDKIGTTDLESETKGLLSSAQSEIMRLSRMVGGMLTLATMSNERERATVDLSSMLKSGAETLRLSLEHKGNRLVTDIAANLKVFGDADLLTQVVTNLIGNAAKYTVNGTITLKACRESGEITVTVTDTGSGIDPQLLPHVFERGTTTDGTGIGLFLCKTIIESHRGKIWVESTMGVGTSVYFSLPIYGGQFTPDR
jgi:signal transduction histidine kinase